ncbi:hypothetical protein [Aestuariibaculum sediminum]|uniref:hypothetical protein n=1 Tax=Aestuariibaculum sediminum TaxID=2770637 RepID=UPI001CB74134|nr:hypothetical protein [Aestuariibaculum sediminum]
MNVNSTYFENIVFDSSSNKIIGLYDVDDNNVSQSLLIIDLNNGNSQTVDLNNVSENSRYSGLVVGNNSKIYGYKYYGNPSGNSSEQKQIVEIDKSNGTSQLVATLNINSTYFGNLVFDSSSNKIIGLYDVDDNNVSQSLLIVDLNNGNSQTVHLNNVSENSRYSGLIVGNNSKLYGYKYYGTPSGDSSEQKQIVEIDKSNGTSQLVATLNVISTYFGNLVFDSSSNKIIGLYDVDDNNVSQSLLIVDLNNGNSQTVDLNNVSENSRYSGLINE